MDKSKKQLLTTSDARYYGFAMRIVADFGATIAVPAIVAVFLGVWIDRKLGTVPWGMMLCLIAAFCLTGWIISRKAKMYGEQFEKLNHVETSEKG